MANFVDDNLDVILAIFLSHNGHKLEQNLHTFLEIFKSLSDKCEITRVSKSYFFRLLAQHFANHSHHPPQSKMQAATPNFRFIVSSEHRPTSSGTFTLPQRQRPFVEMEVVPNSTLSGCVCVHRGCTQISLLTSSTRPSESRHGHTGTHGNDFIIAAIMYAVVRVCIQIASAERFSLAIWLSWKEHHVRTEYRDYPISSGSQCWCVCETAYVRC